MFALENLLLYANLWYIQIQHIYIGITHFKAEPILHDNLWVSLRKSKNNVIFPQYNKMKDCITKIYLMSTKCRKEQFWGGDTDKVYWFGFNIIASSDIYPLYLYKKGESIIRRRPRLIINTVMATTLFHLPKKNSFLILTTNK